ncbi:XRE family transcriptional regulator [Acidilutibacter cellobiosedens]|jgi:DNA-binding Xre family transcriptional regulator|uniref:XRE family transcriptional regulator n=1 Tax=Acidilutibacter cellobiosedens TaxID=2507161 RepID=A0A410Q8G9_9FIRM|nr:helix-turn-helix transcriptional regulator [Acidilutibacter cellobiosedens]QAT60285.1 XRE family transcriptional regulator [Acidilutibacter cellobiosedens]
MGFSYNKLWKILIDEDMNKTDFQKAVELSPTTVAKLGKNETVNMEILARICDYFNCGIEDIVTYSPRKKTNEDENK